MSSGVKKKLVRSAAGDELRQSLSREDWIAAARVELIAGGVSAVKIGRLAKRLRVTRVAFYWHFENHADLLRALLKAWETSNTAPFESTITDQGDRLQAFLAVNNLWLEEREYNPMFDTAVREWARSSREAAAAVRRIDRRRIDILHRIFLDLGYVDPEALVRARVAYFHQVGYYALEMNEPRSQRRILANVYAQVLTGKPIEELEAANARAKSSAAQDATG